VIANDRREPEVGYFRDIERAFVERRGDPLFISNADWVFLSKLLRKGVPKRVVLRGMTDAFDAHAHSFARKQKIRSLKFCEAEITAAVERYRRALRADGPSPRGLPAAIRKLEEALGSVPPAKELGEAIAEARQTLRRVANRVDEDKTYEVDKALSDAEDLLARAAAKALGPEELREIENASREATGSYQSRMPAKVYETLIGESVRRKILQRFGLPRFLLADLE
jgi:hypothetical protein